jgi:hypothetical protein
MADGSPDEMSTYMQTSGRPTSAASAGYDAVYDPEAGYTDEYDDFEYVASVSSHNISRQILTLLEL